MSNPIINKTDQEIFFPDGKEIIINGEKFAIKPFVLKNRTKVLKIFMQLISDFMGKNPDIKKENINFSDVAIDFIGSAGDKLVDIYEITLGRPAEWLLENIQMKHEVEIITAIFEVNDFPFLISQAKQLIAKVNTTS